MSDRGLIMDMLKKSSRILLASPEEPDIDSISCVVAFKEYIKRLHHFCSFESTIAMHCPDSLDSLCENSLYQFLDGADEVITDLPEWMPDCIVIFDYGDIRRARLPEKYAGIPIIGFDHHPPTGPQPSLSIIEPEAASCTVVLYKFFMDRFAGIFADDETGAVRRSLLAGIMSDTGRFSGPGTNPEALRIAAELDLGDEFFSMMHKASRAISLHQIYAEHKILSDHHFYPQCGLRVILADKIHLRHWENVNRLQLLPALNKLGRVVSTKVAALVIENDDGSWTCKLRPGLVLGLDGNPVDVGHIANRFDGGGHWYASGFTWRGNMEDLLDELESQVKEA